MSAALSIASDRRLAKTANSIAARPRSCLLNRAAFAVTLLTAAMIMAHSPNRARWSASKDQLASAGNIAGRHGQPSCGALASRQDIRRAIDRDVVHHEGKTRMAIARFVDGTLEGHGGMGRVDEARDVPGRTIAGIGDIDTGAQIRILVE